jgi:hypothetical protein
MSYFAYKRYLLLKFKIFINFVNFLPRLFWDPHIDPWFYVCGKFQSFFVQGKTFSCHDGKRNLPDRPGLTPISLFFAALAQRRNPSIHLLLLSTLLLKYLSHLPILPFTWHAAASKNLALSFFPKYKLQNAKIPKDIPIAECTICRTYKLSKRHIVELITCRTDILSNLLRLI